MGEMSRYIRESSSRDESRGLYRLRLKVVSEIEIRFYSGRVCWRESTKQENSTVGAFKATWYAGVFYDGEIVASEIAGRRRNARMPRASAVETLEYVIADPPLIASRE